MSHDATELVRLFAECFADSHRTRLVPGGEEPLYRPASEPGGWHEIIFRHDYFQSALHEIAHWCVAGEARRKLVDYGYWYSPDGRSGAQQAEFERVEARPQAVEWVFTVACNKPFRISLDNLDSTDPLDEGSLWRAVQREAMSCLAGALPPRAERFARRLAQAYRQPWPLPDAQFVVPSAFTGVDAPVGSAFGGANSSV